MTTPHSIYDLTDQWLVLMRALEDTLDEETGEYAEPAGIDAAFAALGDDVTAKLGGCGHVLLRLKADADALQAEEKRLRARRGRIEAARERLAERVRELMILTETHTAKTASITVTLAKAPMVLEVTDESAINGMFWIHTAPRLARKEVTAALKRGGNIAGAKLVEGKRGLRVST